MWIKLLPIFTLFHCKVSNLQQSLIYEIQDKHRTILDTGKVALLQFKSHLGFNCIKSEVSTPFYVKWAKDIKEICQLISIRLWNKIN